MSMKQEWLIEEENGFGVEVNGDLGEDGFYNFYLWRKGVSLWLDTDEMYDFMELMTDEETQATFKEEMGKIRLLREVEDKVLEGLEEGKKEEEVLV